MYIMYAEKKLFEKKNYFMSTILNYYLLVKKYHH
jgi:hypothetical protein